MKFDLHMHTTRYSPDSSMDPFVLVARAKEIGLEGIVITEHDCLWPEAELEELRAAAGDLVILGGMEVSAREGHFLVYGILNSAVVPPGIGIADLCREVHAQGGAVVAAHPFRWGQPFAEIIQEEKPELDGLELMSSNMDAECRNLAAKIQEDFPLAGLGSSDAHHERILGVCFTDFAADIRNNRDLVLAIRERKCTAYDRMDR
ncbi:MAG TPA: PHP-associated domain-containing protein [Gemmataceae bacterium]|nr:PHP-associated domain-containing protein [Gemmataceae bacterium]